MSIFDIKKSNAWNYSDPDRAGYSTDLAGIVVGMDNPQQRDFQSGKPVFWDDGSPRRNIRVFIDTADGEKSVTFTPKSALYNAFAKALEALELDSLADAVSRTIRLATEEGAYNRKHPRPWTVELGEVNEGVKLHKVPVIDYDDHETSPVSGTKAHDDDVPFE
mgnify:FL=1